MGRASVPVVVAAALALSGCIPRNSTFHPPSFAPRASAAPAAPVQARSAPRELTPAERRVRELETQLAERDREIAAVRQELAAAAQPAAAPAAPATGARPASSPAPSAAAPAAVASADRAGVAPGAAANEDGAGLAEARQQITQLQARLDGEIERRKAVEKEMARLLEETSASPYERTSASVEQHLRQQLAAARDEVVELRTTLATERRQRGELERRFAALQSQLQQAGDAPADSDEIAALKERQRRVVASIQQDLQASQQRESELRGALERAQGSGGVSLADEVSGLRTENSALQRRLEEEHRANRELAAKLKLAGRVTDLIFKMQSGGAAAGAAPTAQ